MIPNCKRCNYNMGDIFITSENINPSNSLGGEWELIKKEFKELYYNSNISNSGDTQYFSENSINSSTSNIAIIRNGQSILLRINITISVEVTDSQIEIGQFNMNALGLSSYLTLLTSAPFDDGHGICFCKIDGSGKIYTMDSVTRKGDNLFVPANSTGSITFNLLGTNDTMLDRACDKFYWKRIN